MGLRLRAGLVAISLIAATPAWAQGAVPEQLKEVVVTDTKETAQHLTDVAGTKIYDGKKTSVIDLVEVPEIINNNYRQALQKTPGLLLSEESTPLLSIGYRGLEPHRAQFTQVLKDGIPIHADMFGYPEAYYTPAFETIDRIEFVHGGGSLLYGPQPGGALNFITKDPYKGGPLSFTLQNTLGSSDLYSNYMALSGTQDALGYLGYFHHRQSQGFRAYNSQVEVYSGGTKFKVKQDENTVWTAALDVYHEEHGEPGGLTRADFDADPTKANRKNDRFELNRTAGSLAMDKTIDASHALELKAFGGYYERLSWRQRTAGSSFGTAPTLDSNDIESQEFYTFGTEARGKKNYIAFGSDDHVLTAGVFYYNVNSPRIDQRGTTADANEGDVRKDADRNLNNLALFVENRFQFGKLSVTPGLRLENIWQGVKENKNADKTTVPLAKESDYDFVPLFGLGAAYDLSENWEAYSNISQSYRPKIYTQAVPTGSGQVVNDDLKEGKSWQAELGLRGQPTDFTGWDMSVFYMAFEDQIGTSGTTTDNVGDTEHMGVELAGDIDFVGWVDHIKGTQYRNRFGSLSVFANVMLLDAEFVRGPNKGKIPQYAPDFILKTGLEYVYQDKGEFRFSGTFVDDHFANDTNTSQFAVPSYKVWDLTGEWKIYKDTVSLLGGVNNLFDEKYFARVRNDGIDPAAPRNYYAGVKTVW
ncbi:MAG: TonB-dependent receptor plug domain-containing protein [Candidatus Omnitrophica bacterium]|nr:TonB-dependent receptor plug domain-containing protein [Candidatus Omnitrophota bacterium]